MTLLLVLQALLLAWAATRHSPGQDEVAHLAAGLDHWSTGAFDLYAVNPPLVRLVATAPLAAADIELPAEPISREPRSRPEFELARKLVDHHGSKFLEWLFVARWACIPFALLATAMIYCWAAELYGARAGLLSAILWVACPSQLANGQMITPDMGAASLGVTAHWFFWQWVRAPRRSAAVAAGMALGLAELTKTTLVVLGPIWLAGWLFTRGRIAWRGGSLGAELGQLVAVGLLAVLVLNIGYGFEGTGTRVGRFAFVSDSLSTPKDGGGRQNRFADTWLAPVPVPLPRNYVLGMDVQRRDFEQKQWSYLRGEWRLKGWWYYYLYGLLVKLPLGTLFLLGLAVASYALGGRPKMGWRDEVIVLLPAATVLALVSSQIGFTRHLRYVLPALPFIYIWLGRTAAASKFHRQVWAASVVLAVIASSVSSAIVYPHSLSYFNEAVGGPKRGGEHLVDSNLDWGQDLLVLKKWCDAHPEARPLHLAYFGNVDPRVVGIEFELPPPRGAKSDVRPSPGWYAISVTVLRGYSTAVPDGSGGWVTAAPYAYTYFLHPAPIAMAGYSIYIYHLDQAACDAIHAESVRPTPTGAVRSGYP